MHPIKSSARSGTRRFGTPVQLFVFAAIVFAPLAAEAYVGPGAGLSLLSALWGLLCAIGAAFLFVIMWPIRRMRRRKREAREAQTRDSNATGTQTRDNAAPDTANAGRDSNRNA